MDDIRVYVAELPKSCYDCCFGIRGKVYCNKTKQTVDYRGECFLTQRILTRTKRSKYCPLRPLAECEKGE